MDQLAEYSWSHFCCSPLITSGSAGRVHLVTLLLLSTHNPWISWQSTAGHTSVTLHSSPVDQLSEHSWSHFCYSPLITRGSAGRVQQVTFVTLHSSPVDQLAEYSWSHFCYSPLITRGSAGRVQLVTFLLLSTHNQWISWQSTFGHTSVTLHSSPVDQLAEYSWSHFCYSPLITVDQLAEYSWSHFCYSPLITRGSAGRVQLVTLLLLSTHHPWISWQSTAGHTSVTLHSSPVDQLAEYSWSHFCYSPLITRGSAGRVQLVTLLLLSTHHRGSVAEITVTLHSSPSAGRVQLVRLLLLSTHNPWISWQSTAGQTSVSLHS